MNFINNFFTSNFSSISILMNDRKMNNRTQLHKYCIRELTQSKNIEKLIYLCLIQYTLAIMNPYIINRRI